MDKTADDIKDTISTAFQLYDKIEKSHEKCVNQSVHRKKGIAE